MQFQTINKQLWNRNDKMNLLAPYHLNVLSCVNPKHRIHLPMANVPHPPWKRSTIRDKFKQNIFTMRWYRNTPLFVGRSRQPTTKIYGNKKKGMQHQEKREKKHTHTQSNKHRYFQQWNYKQNFTLFFCCPLTHSLPPPRRRRASFPYFCLRFHACGYSIYDNIV